MATERIDPTRRYVIISGSYLLNIDYTQVLENTLDSTRFSIDNNLAILKYNGSMPPTISVINPTPIEYTYEEILSITTGSNWQPEEEEGLYG